MTPKGLLSEERVSDSSDNESSSTDPTQTLKDQVNRTLGAKNSQNGLRKSIAEDESSSSDSDASSIASRSSGSSTASKRKAQNPVRSTAESQVKRTKTSHSNAKRVESSSYLPPAGFAKLNSGDSNSLTNVANALNNLDGKQVWYLTAPSDMPISKLTSLDLTAALSGNPIIEHDDVKYVMTGNRSDETSVMLPRGRDATYTSVNATISRSFRIQELYTNPITGGEVNANSGEDTSQIQFFASKGGQGRAPRQQPANLKSRNIPYGVSRPPPDSTRTHDVSMVDVDDIASDVDIATQSTPQSSKKRKTKTKTDSKGGSATSPDIARSSQVSLSTNSTTPSKEKKKKRDKQRS